MSFTDDLIRIETPENVAFGYPIAGIGSRFLAALLDTVLIVLLQVAVFALTVLLAGELIDIGSATAGSGAAWMAAALGMVGFLFFWGYYIFFELLWNGQSPGKRWTGLRVIRADGRPITLAESVIRNLVRLVDFLPSLYAVGIVVMFLDGRSRRLGDLAAGTLVVREGRAGKALDALLAADEERGRWYKREEEIAHLPLEKLGPAEIDLIDSFLDRRNQFSNPDVIGLQVLQRVYAAMDLPPEPADERNAARRLGQIRSALTHEVGAE